MAVGCFFVFGCLRLRGIGSLGVALRGMIGLDSLHFFDDQRVVGELEHDEFETLLQRLEDDEEVGADTSRPKGVCRIKVFSLKNTPAGKLSWSFLRLFQLCADCQ